MIRLLFMYTLSKIITACILFLATACAADVSQSDEIRDIYTYVYVSTRDSWTKKRETYSELTGVSNESKTEPLDTGEVVPLYKDIVDRNELLDLNKYVIIIEFGTYNKASSETKCKMFGLKNSYQFAGQVTIRASGGLVKEFIYIKGGILAVVLRKDNEKARVERVTFIKE